MADAGFYPANNARDYPFTDAPDAPRLPRAAVVDAGFAAGIGALFTDAVHRVWLYRVARAGDDFTFDFRSDAPGCAGRAVLFHRAVGDPEYATSFAADDVAPGSSSAYAPESSSSGSSDGGGDPDPVLEGFLVTGDLAALAAFLADGEEWTDPDGRRTVEPALVQNLARTYVRRVGLANKDRTRVEPPNGCPGSTSSEAPDADVLVNAAGLTGALKLKEGFNCSIRVNRQDNSVTLSGQVGAGAGEACEEVPLTDDEAPPPGSTLLTGGPRCDEILKSVNGVGGRVVRIQAGDGVRVVPGEAPNTLVVEADLHGLALCAPLVESSVGG